MNIKNLIIPIIGIIFLFYYGFGFCSDDDLGNLLKKNGKDIAEIIIKKDALALLKYIDKEKWEVGYGGDLYKNYQEVKRDLNNPTSPMYCTLFDATCTIEKNEKSIRDYLLEAKSRNMSIDVKVWHESNLTLGRIIYNWHGKPKDLWVSDFPNPEFVYTKNGWKFISLFAE